jgi:hypothetical protein
MGMALRNLNRMNKYIKNRLNLGNACYHLVKNLFSSNLLLKYIEIIKYNINFACCSLYECDTSSDKVRKEYRLRVYENIMLRRMFGPEREEVMEFGEVVG